MPHFHHILASDPQYAPPLMRAASPSSTIGTEYGADETSLSDEELDQDAFERKCLDRLRLNVPRPDEVKANMEPLLQPRPIRPNQKLTDAQEKQLHEQVMNNLRERVRQLEEDELFEQTVLRGTRLSEEEQPSSDDIDIIMRSIMGLSTHAQPSNRSGGATDFVTPSWNTVPQPTTGGTGSTTTAIGRRVTRARTRSRRG